MSDTRTDFGKLWDLQTIEIPKLNRRIEELEQEIELLLPIVQAVAHIGVDFGYGKFDIGKYEIKQAREIIEALTKGEKK